MSYKIAAICVCSTCQKEAPGFMVVEPQQITTTEDGFAKKMETAFSFIPPPGWAQAFSGNRNYCETCKETPTAKYFIEFHPIW